MRVPTTKTSVRALLAVLADADPDEEVTFGKAKTKVLNTCWCGCGGTTGGKFQPGHDSKFHSLAKQVARDQADRPTEFVNYEAEDDFDKHYDKEVPLWAAKVAEEAAKPPKVKKTKKVKKEAEPEVTLADAHAHVGPLDRNSKEYELLLAEVQSKV